MGREGAERFEAAEEGVFQGCLTEILGVFLASWSLEKENRERKGLQVSFEVSFLLILIHIFLILFPFSLSLHCSSTWVG